MGTAKRQSKKYRSPLKIWDKPRIERDKVLRKKYGFKNKKELWKVESVLRNLRLRARDLVGLKALNLGQEEEKEFIATLKKRGLVGNDATIDDVLELNIENLLDRRLQTFVLNKEMARSIREARQIITHRHITVDGKLIDSPSYMVKKDEEDKIGYAESSPLSSSAHPVRAKKEEKHQ
ncbi:MAG: ribosomal protein S4 [Candidatus Parvarchaeum acidophilus ARMAN-5]|jgi:small subunit ribosomal protein S4|uniref:Small ribosomal subunit protein uS4 n=1 Tax=Candidatus Parvarchaeum acidophilus ARMAN-5 TaxID=662762 RepID=D6GVN5_PARA5|nr:MAG: ribosomal protein S4 [Candidatus Parvarchaeum acidophilus ARMAN-5]